MTIRSYEVQELPIIELRIGDVIDFGPACEPYNHATVYSVSPEEVRTVRPYIHLAPTTYGGSENRVYSIDYIGTEHVTLLTMDRRPVRVVRREKP